MIPVGWGDTGHYAAPSYSVLSLSGNDEVGNCDYGFRVLDPSRNSDSHRRISRQREVFSTIILKILIFAAFLKTQNSLRGIFPTNDP